MLWKVPAQLLCRTPSAVCQRRPRGSTPAVAGVSRRGAMFSLHPVQWRRQDLSRSDAVPVIPWEGGPSGLRTRLLHGGRCWEPRANPFSTASCACVCVGDSQAAQVWPAGASPAPARLRQAPAASTRAASVFTVLAPSWCCSRHHVTPQTRALASFSFHSPLHLTLWKRLCYFEE